MKHMWKRTQFVKGKGKPSLVINAASNWLVLILNVVVGMVLTPFLIKQLGRDGYGAWTLVASIVGYSGMLDLGIKSALTRYVSVYFAQKEEQTLRVLVSTAFLASLVATFLCIVCSITLGNTLYRFFRILAINKDEFHLAFSMIGITAGIGFPTYVIKSVLIGRERFVTVNVVTCLLIIARLILLLNVNAIGRGIIGVSVATLIVGVVESALFLCIWTISPDRVIISIKNVKSWMIRQLLGYGSWTSVIAVADELRLNLDSMVIAKFVDVASVTVFRIASIIARYAISAIGATNSVLLPRFSQLSGEGHSDELRSLFVRSLSLSSVISFGGGLGVIMLSGPFIRIWVGESFSSAKYLLWILIGAFTLDICQNPSVGLMYSLNKHRFYAVINILEGLANLALSILLARGYGILGVALGTALPMAFVKLAIQPIFVAKIAGISVRLYYKATMSAGVIAVIAFLIFWRMGMAGLFMEMHIQYVAIIVISVVLLYAMLSELLLRLLKVPSIFSSGIACVL